MAKILVIDIGNTNIAAGLYIGRRLAKTMKLRTGEDVLYSKRLKAFMGSAHPEMAVISSVVPKALRRMKVSLRAFRPCMVVVLGKNAVVPIRNLYRIKGQVGQDRLVNAYGAKALYGAPAVVIDFGTAITFDIVSKKGDYLGGLILPGIDMSLAGLHERTALLPKVGLAPAGRIIGKDTVGSIRGGVLFGFGAMCDALVARYRKIFGGRVSVIATGGNSPLMKRYAKSIRKVDELLTLKGLFLLSCRLPSKNA